MAGGAANCTIRPLHNENTVKHVKFYPHHLPSSPWPQRVIFAAGGLSISALIIHRITLHGYQVPPGLRGMSRIET